MKWEKEILPPSSVKDYGIGTAAKAATVPAAL
jgi:hypothetical protein